MGSLCARGSVRCPLERGDPVPCFPKSPNPTVSPDDSDYDEIPEEGPRAPAGVMTKKVGSGSLGSGQGPSNRMGFGIRGDLVPFAGVQGTCSPRMLEGVLGSLGTQSPMLSLTASCLLVGVPCRVRVCCGGWPRFTLPVPVSPSGCSSRVPTPKHRRRDVRCHWLCDGTWGCPSSARGCSWLCASGH